MRLLLTSLLFSCNLFAQTQLVLTFNTEAEKDQWAAWYLDGGGEPLSGFYVENWQMNSFVMTPEDLQPVVKRKEFKNLRTLQDFKDAGELSGDAQVINSERGITTDDGSGNYWE